MIPLMSPIRYLYGSPTTSYLICTTPRSGSTFLSQALASTGVAGRPEEYFQQLTATSLPRRPVDYLQGLTEGSVPTPRGAPDGDHRVDPMFDPRRFAGFGDYVSWVLGTATTGNGVFGAKIMSAYMEGLAAGLREALGGRAPETTPELLAAVFPRLRYIFLVRADKVRQAVSLWRAIQTWQWREDAPEQGPAGGEPGDGGLRYDFAALDHLRRRLVEEEEWWRGYFAAAGVEPLTIVYERFADGHDEVVRAVLRHLEIPFDGSWTLPSPTVRRQSDGLSREWAERYAEESVAAEPR
jgi:trehalose 2-sulfotransferase